MSDQTLASGNNTTTTPNSKTCSICGGVMSAFSVSMCGACYRARGEARKKMREAQKAESRMEREERWASLTQKQQKKVTHRRKSERMKYRYWTKRIEERHRLISWGERRLEREETFPTWKDRVNRQAKQLPFVMGNRQGDELDYTDFTADDRQKSPLDILIDREEAGEFVW